MKGHSLLGSEINIMCHQAKWGLTNCIGSFSCNTVIVPHFNQAIEEDGLQKNSEDVGTYMLLELAKLRDKFEIVGDVRGKGLMIGVEMVTDKVSDLLYSFQFTVSLKVLSHFISVEITGRFSIKKKVK